MSLNVCSFTGRLGKDAVVRAVGDRKVLSFTTAVDTGYGEKKDTMWISCSAWGKMAEGKLADYLKKGQQVAISGELSTRRYQAEDGSDRTSIELSVSRVELIGSKSDDGEIPFE